MDYVSVQRFNAGNENPLYTSASLTSGAPHSSSGKLKFVTDDAVIDTAGLVSDLNNNIILNNSGVYRIAMSCTAKVYCTEPDYNGAWWAQIVINNKEVAQHGVELGPVDLDDRHTSAAEIILNLSAGDIIDVRVAPQGVKAPIVVYSISINVQQLS